MNNFVFTGKAYLFGMRVIRKDLERLASKNFCGVYNKVDYYVDYLVTDSSNVTKKRTDAMKFGAKIISTKEFVDMMGGELELTTTGIG